MAGTATGSALERETDDEPEYRDWLEEGPARARRALGAALDRPPEPPRPRGDGPSTPTDGILGSAALDGMLGDPRAALASATQVADWAMREEVHPGVLQLLRQVDRLDHQPHLGSQSEGDPKELSQAGWAVVFHSAESATTRQLLRPLIEHRRATCGAARSRLLEYRPGESWRGWLARHGVAAGHPVPTRVPYYLLLIGPPSAIPDDFERRLGIEYAVGRLSFEEPEALRRYVAQVIEHETAPPPPADATALFFAPRQPSGPMAEDDTDPRIEKLPAVVAEGGDGDGARVRGSFVWLHASYSAGRSADDDGLHTVEPSAAPLVPDGSGPSVGSLPQRLLDHPWRPGAAREKEAHEPPPRPPGWQPTPGLDLPWRPHWRIEHQLGAGGFGEAWLAAHRKTGEKRVFKFCWEAPQLRALQREITLFRLLKEELGDRMDIARILDWDFDRIPYSIESDYAALGNLAEWAEARGGIGRIPLATRLEIVAQVATALAAAHSVGILHKDVKPTNILVVRDDSERDDSERDDSERDDPERDDGEGLRVQLADFGIGALTEPDRLAAAGITALGLTTEGEDSASGSGTRLYMAPELLEGKRPTLQADIYALGVLLYQMLTGDFSRALASGWQRDIDDELLRRDLATMVDGSPERRPGDALRIAEELRTLKSRRRALEAERREHEAARRAREALARSRRRRKLMVSVIAVLLVFAATMGYLANRVAREAEYARQEAQRANREALLARETVDFLKGLFEVSNPAVGRGETVTARELLDRGSERIRHGLGEQPLSRALLMDTMGTVYQQLGLYDSALPLLEEALALRREQLGGEHPDVATSLVHLAKVRRLEGHFDEARPLFRQALDIFEHSLGPDHPGLVPTLNGLGATAWAQGRHDEAEQYFRRALDILEAGGQQSDPDLARTLNNLGMLASTRGRYEEAESSYGRALDILEQTRDVRDPELATALENLGIFHAKQGHYEEAVRYYRRTLAI